MIDLQNFLDDNLKKVQFVDDENLNDIENVSVIVAKCRTENGLTQKELSERTGIQQATISKIENGTFNPTVKMLERIAEGLDKKLVIKFE